MSDIYPDPKVHVNIIRLSTGYKIQVFNNDLAHLEEARYMTTFEALDAVKANGLKLAAFIC
jgi:hypothetical protein